MQHYLFQSRTVTGQPITLGRFTLTPQAKVLTMRFPFGSGGFVWNRTDAVLVEEGGQSKRYPVPDATRLIHLVLLGGGLILTIINFLIRKQSKEAEK